MMYPLPKRLRRMASGPSSPTSGSPIPDDVIFFQILVRLPVKCLLRFQTVCKPWRATLTSTHFAHRHLEHSRTRPSMVMMPRRYLRHHRMFNLCGVGFYGFQPVATRKLQFFAKGQRVAFGFDPWSGKYKVARHFVRSGSETPQADGEKCSAGHEILTLGDGEEVWKWKSTMDPPYAINARTPICMRGSFYWSAVSSVTGGDGHNKGFPK
nr:unnamed protein product [Digitaria exilis]